MPKCLDPQYSLPNSPPLQCQGPPYNSRWPPKGLNHSNKAPLVLLNYLKYPKYLSVHLNKQVTLREGLLNNHNRVLPNSNLAPRACLQAPIGAPPRGRWAPLPIQAWVALLDHLCIRYNKGDIEAHHSFRHRHESCNKGEYHHPGIGDPWEGIHRVLGHHNSSRDQWGRPWCNIQGENNGGFVEVYVENHLRLDK